MGLILDNGGGTGLFLEFLQNFSSFLAGNQEMMKKLILSLNSLVFLSIKNYQINLISMFPPPMVICDISFEMLQVARKFNDSKILYGLVSCDSAHLPFRNSQFSTITAFTVFQNIENINQAIEESYRVLTDRGVLGISMLEKSSDKFQFAELLGKSFDDIKPVHFEQGKGGISKNDCAKW